MRELWIRGDHFQHAQFKVWISKVWIFNLTGVLYQLRSILLRLFGQRIFRWRASSSSVDSNEIVLAIVLEIDWFWLNFRLSVVAANKSHRIAADKLSYTLRCTNSDSQSIFKTKPGKDLRSVKFILFKWIHFAYRRMQVVDEKCQKDRKALNQCHWWLVEIA